MFRSQQNSTIRNTENLLQVNDINLFKNWCYSIKIHFLSVLIFHNNMPMYDENL